MSVITGISTACMYPLLTEESLKTVCDLDVDAVEIFINSDCELKEDFLKKMKNTLDLTNTKCASVHPFTCGIEPMMLFTYYERRFYDMLEYYKKFFNAMNILGAKIFVLHGNKPQNKFDDDSYFERYEGLYDLGKTFGVTLTHENVERCTAGSLDFMVKMKKALGDKACFTLDVKQAVRKGLSPYDFVNALGNNIKHVHLSDHNEKIDCTLVGKGNLNFEKFYSSLKAVGFDGAIILELYRNGFNEPKDLGENYKFIKKIIENNP